MQTQSKRLGLRSPDHLAWLTTAIALLLLACGAKHGAPPAADARDVIRIATSGDYPPFSSWPPGAERPEGFEPDLLARWASATGRRVQWQRFRWPDLVAQAKGGAFDLAAGGITVRVDRSLAGTFGIPLATSGAVALVPGARPPSLDALDDPGVRIAVNRGGHLERVVRSRFPLAQIVATTPNDAVPERLSRGEVDAVVTDTREAPIWRRAHAEWRVLGPFTRDRKAVFAAPGHEALLAELDAWLLGPVGSRTLDALRLEHLGDDPASAHVSQLGALLAAIDERLSLMPAVARTKRAHGLPIEVPEREASVLDAAWREVGAAAAAAAVAPPPKPRVAEFFRAQIAAAKELQSAVVAPVPGAPSEPVLDLDETLRPALNRIGARISQLLVGLPAEPPGEVRARTLEALSDQPLSAATVAGIADALERLLPEEPAAAARR